jgi:hypothetical protein
MSGPGSDSADGGAVAGVEGAEVPPPRFDPGEGWRLVDATVETPFDVGAVTVTAHTVVFEDVRLREAVAERADVDVDVDADASGTEEGAEPDRLWRFAFATRLRLRPRARSSAALTSLVTNRARSGFVDRLRDRGFEAVSRRETRRFRVGDADAALAAYDAVARVGDVRLAVDGWVAVWPDGDGFLMAGGAYPTAVRDDGGDPETAAALAERLSPTAFREELFDLIRRTA